MPHPFSRSVPLAPLTSLKVGGVADYFTTVRTPAELKDALAQATELRVPVWVLGGGTNVVVSDGVIPGLVIKNDIAGIRWQEKEKDVLVTVGGGMWFDDLVREACTRGYWGLENLSGIPGSVGGGVVQNINAYGVTLGDLVHEVEVVAVQTGQTETLGASECAFAYRQSRFKDSSSQSSHIVTGVRLRLSRHPQSTLHYQSASQSMRRRLSERGIDNPTPLDIRAVVLDIRQAIGMTSGQYQSAGSFFTNPILSHTSFQNLHTLIESTYKEQSIAFAPWHWVLPDGSVKVSAAFLLECTRYNKTSFSEERYNGTVSISPVHSLSIITHEGVTANDVIEFAECIKREVKDQFAIELHAEVCLMGGI